MAKMRDFENLPSRKAGKGAKMSSDVGSGQCRTLRRFSTMFSSLQEKLHRDRGDKEPSQNGPQAPSPAKHSAQSQEHQSGQFFFEYLVVVSLKRKKPDATYEPQIIYQFPKLADMGRCQREEEEKSLKVITLFCFPEGVNWAPLTEYHRYIRNMITWHTSNLHNLRIFDEVEKRRQISRAMIYPFMQSLREAQFPAPGNTVKIKSFIPETGTEIISLTRPCDSWLEHVDFKALFHCLSDQEVLQVFAATVMERRVIFIADELSTLSQALHAVVALLYPFTWQHTFISIVPTVLIDVVIAPTPYLLGVQKTLLARVDDQSDMLTVDLSTDAENKFITSMGDENRILPEKLQEELLQALSAKKDYFSPEELNTVVSEAFLSFFMKTVGHFPAHIKRGTSGQPAMFQTKKFCKSAEPKPYRQFVKNFKTQMFDLFIQEVEKQPDNPEGFFLKKVTEAKEKKSKEKSKSGWVRNVML